MRWRFFDDMISAGDFWGPAAGLRPRRPVPVSAGDCPWRRPASAGLGLAPAGDRLAGATAVAWAAAPGGASVRERLAAGGADGDDMALRGSKSTSRVPPLRLHRCVAQLGQSCKEFR